MSIPFVSAKVRIKIRLPTRKDFFLLFWLKIFGYSEEKAYFCIVIQLDRHIEILLLSYDCVTVPGLGGFMAHHVDAHHDATDNQFLPPQRTLGFSTRLTLNDNLLTHSYIEAYDLSYPEATRRIENEVEEIRQHIESNGSYDFPDLGTLVLNEDGNYEFTPCEAGVLTPTLYGLSSYEMQPISALRPTNMYAVQPVKLTTDEEEPEKTISIRVSVLRNALAIAAAIIAFFFIVTPRTTTGGLELSDFNPASLTRIMTDKLGGNTATPKLDEKTLSKPTTIAPTAVAPAPTVQPAAPTAHWTIVLASGVTREGADNYIDQLRTKGFPEGNVLEKRGNSRKVTYGHFANANDAYNTLASLRKNADFREAWVLEVK